MELDFSYLNLNKLPFENHESYLDRTYFVLNNKDEYHLEKLILYSFYLHSIKYQNCTYNQEIMDLVIKLSRNAGIILPTT